MAISERAEKRRVEKIVGRLPFLDKKSYFRFFDFLGVLQRRGWDLTFEPEEISLVRDIPGEQSLEVRFQKQGDGRTILNISPDDFSVKGSEVNSLCTVLLSHACETLAPFLPLKSHVRVSLCDPQSNHLWLFIDKDGKVKCENPDDYDYLGRRRSS